MTDIEKLRQECIPFLRMNTISSFNEALKIYANCLLHITDYQQHEEVKNTADKDGRIILQMIMTKIIYLKSAVNGIEFEGHGIKLDRIVDPTIIAIIVRNLFETSAIFNLIFRTPCSSDERDLVYLMWVIAGLKYRQKFESDIETNEGRQQLRIEVEEIEKIEKQIENTQTYKDLDEINQGKIKTRIKKKDYLIRVTEKKVEFLHWHHLIRQMGFKENLIDNIYNYLSLYTHPSNVSVFQFDEMFKKGKEMFFELSYFNLKIALFMTSSFIADYIKVFPSSLEVFNKLRLRDQIVINFYNTMPRGDDYSINECIQKLG